MDLFRVPPDDRQRSADLDRELFRFESDRKLQSPEIFFVIAIGGWFADDLISRSRSIGPTEECRHGITMPLVFGRPRQGKSADLDKIVDIGILGSASCQKPRHQAGLPRAGRLITSVGDGGSLRLGKVQRKQT